jgi:acetoin utilization protein AcuB
MAKSNFEIHKTKLRELTMRIKQIMTTNLIEANSDASLKDLAGYFDEHNIHHLPVVNSEGALVGILSDRDVNKSSSPFIGTDKERDQDRACLDITAHDVMTKEPITVTEETRIDTASILLLEHNFSCLPVVNEDEELVGLVTWKDILNYYVYSAT